MYCWAPLGLQGASTKSPQLLIPTCTQTEFSGSAIPSDNKLTTNLICSSRESFIPGTPDNKFLIPGNSRRREIILDLFLHVRPSLIPDNSRRQQNNLLFPGTLHAGNPRQKNTYARHFPATGNDPSNFLYFGPSLFPAIPGDNKLTTN